jgi:hypothetical protein
MLDNKTNGVRLGHCFAYASGRNGSGAVAVQEKAD